MYLKGLTLMKKERKNKKLQMLSIFVFVHTNFVNILEGKSSILLEKVSYSTLG